MKLFLGVDGGQSSTVALIADETGRVLGAGKGGPCNHVTATEGRAKFARAIDECVGKACLEAGLDPVQIAFDAACLGFSGGVTDKEAYSREFIRSQAFKITHDAEIALTGAASGQPGIIVIAGTGSIAFGRNSQGKQGRAGGWGYIFGDEGGGFDVVRQALRAALAMEEGWGNGTVLRSQLLAATGSTSANQLMHNWYNNLDRGKVASLATLVDKSASEADAVSIQILQTAGRQLADLATHVHSLLFEPREKVFVSYVGGVFDSSTLVRGLQHAVRDQLNAEAVPPKYPPAAGALLEALKMAGIERQLSDLPAVKS